MCEDSCDFFFLTIILGCLRCLWEAAWLNDVCMFCVLPSSSSGWRSLASVPHWLCACVRVMSRLLLVSLLFVSVPCSVLDVGRAGAEPVQVTTVLCIVDMILKEHLWGKIKTDYREQTLTCSFNIILLNFTKFPSLKVLSSGTGHNVMLMTASSCDIQALMCFFPTLCGGKLCCKVTCTVIKGRTVQICQQLWRQEISILRNVHSSVDSF